MIRVEGVLLAAGKSERTPGDYKLTFDILGKSMIERSLESLLSVCSKVTVVTGHNHRIIETLLSPYEAVTCVVNPNVEDGMYASVKVGLRQCHADLIFILPGDCPMVSDEVFNTLLAASANHKICIPQFKLKTGHPVLIDKETCESILKTDTYHTLRDYLNDHAPHFVKVADAAILHDIDTREAYESLVKNMRDDLTKQEPMHEKSIGDSIKRMDFDEKIEATAAFCADIKRDDLLYAKTLRSIHPRAKILSIKTPLLEEGYFIVDASDIPGDNVLPIVFEDQPVFATDEVNYIGEPLLLVVGPVKEKIMAILAAIEVDYEVLAPTLTVEAAEAEDPFIYYEYDKGNFESAKNKSVARVEDIFNTGYQEHVYIEPQSLLADYKEGVVTVYGSMQCPYYIKDTLKRVLGWPENRIRVIQLPTGGAFGGKEEYPSVMGAHASLAAIKSGKPVQLVLDRKEDIATTTKRHPSQIKLISYLDAQGTIIAREADVTINLGAYAGLSSVVLQRLIFSVFGVYNIENLHVAARGYKTNTIVTGAFRGFGCPQAFFAIEMHMENVAKKLGRNPLELRSAYFLKKNDTTSTGGRLFSDIKLDEITDRIDSMSAFNKKYENPDETKLHGIGLSVFFHGCGFTGIGEKELLKSKVKLKKYSDGTVEIFASSTEIGQGSMTTLSKIVAQALDLPIDKIIHAYPDTATCPDSGPTVASRTVMIVGKLLYDLSLELKEKWCEGELEVTKQYVYPSHLTWDNDKLSGNAYPEYAWGANVVEVEIDPLTFEIKVEGIWAVYDIGIPIDARIVKGQIDGGILQGLGYATMEVLDCVDGKLLQDDLTKYLIPCSADFPAVQSQLIFNPYENGPFGAKGVGELSIIGVAPAFAAAVQNAINKKITKIPITPESIMELMTHEN